MLVIGPDRPIGPKRRLIDAGVKGKEKQTSQLSLVMQQSMHG